MARAARSREVRFTRVCIADENTRGLHARLVVARGGEAVDERGDGLNLFVAEAELRHPAIGTGILDHRTDQLPALVVEHDFGAEPARYDASAPRVGAADER